MAELATGHHFSAGSAASSAPLHSLLPPTGWQQYASAAYHPLSCYDRCGILTRDITVKILLQRLRTMSLFALCAATVAVPLECALARSSSERFFF